MVTTLSLLSADSDNPVFYVQYAHTRIAGVLPPRAAILGDFNLVGPTFLPGFRDVGPREPTHIAGDMMPLRIDRCVVRGPESVEPVSKRDLRAHLEGRIAWVEASNPKRAARLRALFDKIVWEPSETAAR